MYLKVSYKYIVQLKISTKQDCCCNTSSYKIDLTPSANVKLSHLDLPYVNDFVIKEHHTTCFSEF